MTSVVIRKYASTNGTTARLWYSTWIDQGTVYFRFTDGTKAHEYLKLHGDDDHMGIFAAQNVLDAAYTFAGEVRKR